MTKHVGNILEIRRLSLSIGPEPVLADLSFKVSEPGLIGLFGASGSGKSSLCRAATRLLEDDRWQLSGDILLYGQSVFAMQETELRRKILYVRQRSVALPGTVLRNLELPQKCVLRERSGNKRRDEARRACRLAGLPCERDFLMQPAETLSGGELQRLAIARALVLKPAVLVFDEPTSALDPVLSVQTAKTLRRIAETKPVIVVTHDMRIGPLCTSVLYLHNAERSVPRLYQGHYEDVFECRTGPGFAFAHPWPTAA